MFCRWVVFTQVLAVGLMLIVAFESITPAAKEVGLRPSVFATSALLLFGLALDNAVQVQARTMLVCLCRPSSEPLSAPCTCKELREEGMGFGSRGGSLLPPAAAVTQHRAITTRL